MSVHGLSPGRDEGLFVISTNFKFDAGDPRHQTHETEMGWAATETSDFAVRNRDL